MLKSFLENIGEGKLVLKKENKNKDLILIPVALGKKLLSIIREPQAYMYRDTMKTCNMYIWPTGT